MVIDGNEAEISYSRVGKSQIIIDHTEVPDVLRGRKVGERLVRQAVEDARRDRVVIIPLCLAPGEDLTADGPYLALDGSFEAHGRGADGAVRP